MRRVTAAKTDRKEICVMSDLVPKLFCPLLSTAGKKVYCDKNCMWYVYNDDFTGHTCSVPLLLETIAYQSEAADECDEED